MNEYQPPIACVEVEQELLGAILHNGEACDVATQIIDIDDLYEPVHKTLLASFIEARAEGRAITITLAKAALGDDSKRELMADFTVGQYLARLAATATTVINAGDFAKTIREYADRRRLDAIGETLREAARTQAAPVSISQDGVAALDTIASRYTDNHARQVWVDEAAQRSVDRMTAAMLNEGRITGISTGLRDIDAKTNGWQRGDLIILAGRTSMGKSGLSVSSLRQSGCNALYFSLEMGSENLADRVLTDMNYGNGKPIPYFALGRGSLSNPDAERIIDTATALRGCGKLRIDPQGGLTLGQIAARARKHKQTLERQGKVLDVVCVDHMHIIRPSQRYAGNRTGELTEISAGLKALAKELNVAVLALAQMSRKGEDRDDKRPLVTDLRDSGTIEQDADAILLLYREAYYLERAKFNDVSKDNDRIARLGEVENLLEVIIGKNRNGPTGTVQVFFNMASNAARDWGHA